MAVTTESLLGFFSSRMTFVTQHCPFLTGLHHPVPFLLAGKNDLIFSVTDIAAAG